MNLYPDISIAHFEIQWKWLVSGYVDLEIIDSLIQINSVVAVGGSDVAMGDDYAY